MDIHRHSTRTPMCRPGKPLAATWTIAFTVLATLSTTVPSAGHAAEKPDQVPALQEPPLTQYRALRRMHARNEKFNQEAWIEAWTELNGQSFSYEIASERGSEYIRNKVLKAMLTREQEL